jgi:hypothetical protein
MKRWAPVLAAVVVCGCANAPVKIDSRAMADQISRSPEHFIIAAVESDPSVFAAHAASTPRGYDSIARARQHAVRCDPWKTTTACAK